MRLYPLYIKKTKNMANDEKGQSLVEFILLLSIVAIISIGFLRIVNGKVADYWLAMGEMLVEDENQSLNLR